MEKKIYLVIASGRTHKEILKIIPELELDKYDFAYLIAYNGVLTVKTKPEQIIDKVIMERSDISYLDDLTKRNHLYMHVFTEKSIYLSSDIPDSKVLDQQSGCPVRKIDFACFPLHEEIFKVLIVDDKDKLDAFRKRLQSDHAELYNIFKSAPSLLEFVNIKASKGAALKYLIKYLHIKKEETVAFGDEENDISLLRESGIGVAMGNAVPEVKAAANMVTLSNDLDGVAHAIDNIMNRGVNNGV